MHQLLKRSNAGRLMGMAAVAATLMGVHPAGAQNYSGDPYYGGYYTPSFFGGGAQDPSSAPAYPPQPQYQYQQQPMAYQGQAYQGQGGYVMIGPDGTAYQVTAPAAEPAPQRQRQSASSGGGGNVGQSYQPTLNPQLWGGVSGAQYQMGSGADPLPDIPESASVSHVRYKTADDKFDEVIGAGIIHHQVTGGESLIEVARAYDLGYNDIHLANPGVNTHAPQLGMNLRLPLFQILPDPDLDRGLVINLPEMRIYHYRTGSRVDTYPVGIGKEGTDTPVAKAKLVRKKADPTWHVPKSILVKNPGFPEQVPPGPENPLGTHALYLSLNGYLIHGTNQPFGIGKRVSHGCIRMYPEDIVQLYGQAGIGEPVHIVNLPVKVGWKGEELYLEVHPQLKNYPLGDQNALAQKAIESALQRRASWKDVAVDWNLVRQTVGMQDGIPVRIAGRSSMQASQPVPMMQSSAVYGGGYAGGYGSQGSAMAYGYPGQVGMVPQMTGYQTQAGVVSPIQNQQVVMQPVGVQAGNYVQPVIMGGYDGTTYDPRLTATGPEGRQIRFAR